MAKKRLWIIATVAVATVAVAGPAIIPKVSNIGGGSPPGNGEANIWVDTSGGTCTRNSSPTTYVDASACASLNAAYAIANAGDTVGIHAGDYRSSGIQVINNRSALNNLSPACDPLGEWGSVSTQNCVRFIPDGNVTTASIAEGGSSVWFNGTRTGSCTTATTCDAATYNWTVEGVMNIEDVNGPSYPNGTITDHVVWEGITALGMMASDGNHLQWHQVAYGGVAASGTGSGCTWRFVDTQTVLPGSADFTEPRIIRRRTNTPPAYITIDESYEHDYDRDATNPGNDCHFGGMGVSSGNHLVFRRNVYSQLWVYTFEFKNDFEASPGPRDNPSNPTIVRFENNVFGCDVDSKLSAGNRTTCSTQASIQTDFSPNTDWLIQYNSAAQQGLIGCYTSSPDCTYSNFRIIGNVGPVPETKSGPICGTTGTTYAYNVWVGGTCGGTGETTDTNLATTYGSTPTAGAENLHLAAGSNANDRVIPNTSDYVPTGDVDIDGQARTPGSRDAGSDER